MFSVKQYVADQGLTPFPFEDVNGEKQELPNFMLMTAKQAGAFAEKLDNDPLAAMAEIAPDLADRILETPVAAVNAFVDAYMKHCKGNANQGESEASPEPSKSTARRSSATLPASTRKTTRKR